MPSAIEIGSSISCCRFESVQLVKRSEINWPLGTITSDPLVVRMMLARNYVAAMIKLHGFDDTYLFVTRILDHLDKER